MDARAGSHDQGQKNFVGAWGVGDAYFHGVEMAAHVGGVDVRDGNVEARAWPANFFVEATMAFAPPSISRMA